MYPFSTPFGHVMSRPSAPRPALSAAGFRCWTLRAAWPRASMSWGFLWLINDEKSLVNWKANGLEIRGYIYIISYIYIYVYYICIYNYIYICIYILCIIMYNFEIELQRPNMHVFTSASETTRLTNKGQQVVAENWGPAGIADSSVANLTWLAAIQACCSSSHLLTWHGSWYF